MAERSVAGGMGKCKAFCGKGIPGVSPNLLRQAIGLRQPECGSTTRCGGRAGRGGEWAGAGGGILGALGILGMGRKRGRTPLAPPNPSSLVWKLFPSPPAFPHGVSFDEITPILALFPLRFRPHGHFPSPSSLELSQARPFPDFQKRSFRYGVCPLNSRIVQRVRRRRPRQRRECRDSQRPGPACTSVYHGSGLSVGFCSSATEVNLFFLGVCPLSFKRIVSNG